MGHFSIETAIINYSNESPTTINEAILRNKKNKSWLVHLQGSLQKDLKDLGIDVDIVPQQDIDLFSKSEDAEELKKIWFKRHTASHDVIAYMYVRKKRQYNFHTTSDNKLFVRQYLHISFLDFLTYAQTEYLIRP